MIYKRHLKKVVRILRTKGILTLSEKIINAAYRILSFRIVTRKTQILSTIQYTAPAHPYKKVRTPSKKIKKHLVKGEIKEKPLHSTGLGNIKDGNWDKNCNTKQMGNGLKPRAYEEVFIRGKRWEETDYYEYAASRIKDEGEFKGAHIEKPDDFLNKLLNRTENLYNSMNSRGYVAGHNGKRVVPGSGQLIANRLEILVVIDRNGEILFFDGRHRLYIAQILHIDVTVQVVCRHKKWQELRDDIYNDGFSEEHEDLRDHPDLQDVLD